MENIQNNNIENDMTNHKVSLQSRNAIQITGVTNVESASESGMVLYVGSTLLTIEGENLKVQKIDVDAGNVEAVGLVKSMKYSDSKSKGGLLKKLRS